MKKLGSTVQVSPAFNDHKRKAIIRKVWCKPLLHQLTQVLKDKLVYLGLPDIEAKDILEWIEYIDKVIAFQCSNYKGVNIDVTKLDKLLQSLERQNKIRSGFVYQGWMEDIVMGAVSERGDTYMQTDYLRVYNLDFCNSLKTPREVRDAHGRVIKIIHKTDVIRKLLQHQSAIKPKGKKDFIMYLTVNANTFNDDGSTIKDPAIREYLRKVGKIKKPEVKAAREMKAYCLHTLKMIFEEQGFHVEFLPPVYYFGSGYPNKTTGRTDNHRMMTFTIVGTQRENNEVFFQQDSGVFLDQKFIFATDTKISPYQDKLIQEIDCEHDPIKLINNSGIYKQFWTTPAKP